MFSLFHGKGYGFKDGFAYGATQWPLTAAMADLSHAKTGGKRWYKTTQFSRQGFKIS